MLTLSWGQLKAIIKSELDLDEETFVDDDELRNYANKAIDEAEQLVLSIYQDYFRTRYVVPLVTGTSDYVMPTDIYANKIRYVYYYNGSTKYKIERIKPKHIPFFNGSEDYCFDVEHKASTGPNDSGIRFMLYPAAKETATGPVTMWYIRNATRLVDDNSPIDIPEATNFMRAYVARELAKKEVGLYLLPRESGPEQELEKQSVLLKQALDSMIPDDDDTIEPDLSFYADFNQNYVGG